MARAIGDSQAHSSNELTPKLNVTLRVNGVERRLSLRPWTTLLDALRDYLDLTGTKKGCDHVPVNADVHDIEIIFVDEREAHLNPLGIKGVGEIGIVGVAAAIANAAYHATGIRVRDLPITIDKLLGLTPPK